MSDDRLTSFIYRELMYQNRRGLVVNLLFLFVILIVLVVTGIFVLFYLIIGDWIAFLDI